MLSGIPSVISDELLNRAQKEASQNNWDEANKMARELIHLEGLIVKFDHLIPEKDMIDGKHELHNGSGHVAYRHIEIMSKRILGLPANDDRYKDLNLGSKVRFSSKREFASLSPSEESIVIGFSKRDAKDDVSVLLAQEVNGEYNCQWTDLRDITEESLLKTTPNENYIDHKNNRTYAFAREEKE